MSTTLSKSQASPKPGGACPTPRDRTPEMHDDWIERQKDAAPDDLAETPELLDRIESWQEKARAEAEKHKSAATKKAVQHRPPGAHPARALFGLYARHAEDIYHICRTQLPDESGLGLEDVLQESYPLFQRSMVRYDPEKAGLRTWLVLDLRGRVGDYLQSMSHERVSEEDRDEPKTETIAPGFDIPALYSELVDKGRVDDEAAELYDRLHPERG